jgi:F-type H+-transporting ATPase subunit a
MGDSLALTRLLNQIFGGPVTGLLNAIGVHPAHPGAPINDVLTLELIVVAGLIAFFIAVRLTLSVEKPAPIQQFAEMIHEFVDGQSEQIIGHNYERFSAFVTMIFLFVLVCNLLGLIPGIDAPTKFPIVPLGLAIPTFLYYHIYGFREQGFKGYLGHFAGPIWWIAPLLFPIEIVSHFARIMSLTIRLYANMFAGDLVTLVFFSLVPVGVPIVFLGLHLMVSLIQAYVFMLLAMIYLAQATAHEH